MGIDVQVLEYGGALVARVGGSVDVKVLCSFAALDRSAFPLLSGVDPYDDTTFNARQAAVLAVELRAIAELVGPESVRQAAAALLPLVALLETQPGRPHHRRLLFSGD